MSPLATKLRTLRGDLTQDEVIERAGVSIATLNRAERNGDIKLESLRQIAAAYNPSPEDYSELLQLYVKQLLGPDASKLTIEPKTSRQLHDQVTNPTTRIQTIVTDMPAEDQADILTALENPRLFTACKEIIQLAKHLKN